MKILIVCSKYFYNEIPEIKTDLEGLGHKVMLPNSYDAPLKEEEMKKIGKLEHSIWKQSMMRTNEFKIKQNDGLLVLNYKKNNQQNYIGGATFMEIMKAWELNKKIYLYNPIPENIFTDELTAINPILINQDLINIK